MQAWHSTLDISPSAELSVCGRMSYLYYGCMQRVRRLSTYSLSPQSLSTAERSSSLIGPSSQQLQIQPQWASGPTPECSPPLATTKHPVSGARSGRFTCAWRAGVSLGINLIPRYTVDRSPWQIATGLNQLYRRAHNSHTKTRTSAQLLGCLDGGACGVHSDKRSWRQRRPPSALKPISRPSRCHPA